MIPVARLRMRFPAFVKMLRVSFRAVSFWVSESMKAYLQRTLFSIVQLFSLQESSMRDTMNANVLYFMFYLVVVAVGSLSADEFSQESGQEKLGSENHHGQCDVEVGGLGHQGGMCAVVECD